MKKFSFGWVLFLAIIFLTAASHAGPDGYDHRIDVDDMQFNWRIAGETINIKLSADTTGWVGIGFNPSEEMKDANFIIGYVKKGKVKITDHFGTSKRQHEKDTKIGGNRDLTNISGQEADGVTEIAFTIPLNSQDSKDKALSIDRDTKVLLAYGTGRDSFRSKHKFKTALLVNLGTGQYKTTK